MHNARRGRSLLLLRMNPPPLRPTPGQIVSVWTQSATARRCCCREPGWAELMMGKHRRVGDGGSNKRGNKKREAFSKDETEFLNAATRDTSWFSMDETLFGRRGRTFIRTCSFKQHDCCSCYKIRASVTVAWLSISVTTIVTKLKRPDLLNRIFPVVVIWWIEAGELQVAFRDQTELPSYYSSQNVLEETMNPYQLLMHVIDLS